MRRGSSCHPKARREYLPSQSREGGACHGPPQRPPCRLSAGGGYLCSCQQSFSQMRAGGVSRLWKVLRQGCPVQPRGRPVNLRGGGSTPLPLFEHHVFVCHNVRPDGAPRPSCTSDGKSDVFTQLQQLAKAAGLTDRVRVN